MSWKRFCAAKKTDYGYVWRFAKLVVSVIVLSHDFVPTHFELAQPVLAGRG